MGRRAVSGGKLILWREALAEARRQRRHLLTMVLPLIAVLVLVNVLPAQPYLKGMLTGAVAMTGVAAALVSVWVGGGFWERLQGAWAEEWSGEALRKSAGCWHVTPSLKFDRFDIDHVAITARGVLAVESKWHRRSAEQALDAEARLIAGNARTLRHNLKTETGQELPVHPVLVLWGPGLDDLTRTEVTTNLGLVEVVPGPEFGAWLDAIDSGPMRRGNAKRVGQAIEDLAERREEVNVQAGPVLTWLARAR